MRTERGKEKGQLGAEKWLQETALLTNVVLGALLGHDTLHYSVAIPHDIVSEIAIVSLAREVDAVEVGRVSDHVGRSSVYSDHVVYASKS